MYKTISVIISLLLLLQSGCIGGRYGGIRNPIGETMISGVHYYPQTGNDCGVSSLASVLNYWGKNVTPAQVSAAVFSSKLKGTLAIDIVNYANKMGLEASLYRGSIEDIKIKVKAGYPLILFVDTGILNYKVGHYLVVNGLNDNNRYLISNWGEKKVTSYSYIESVWKKTGHQTILVKPVGS